MTLPSSDAASAWGIPFNDYAPVEDPTTDLAAASFNQIGADVAMMTHTATRAWVRFVGATYVGPTDTIPVVDHDAVWGSASGVKPVVTETAAGVYTITWATTQTDELAAVHTLAIRKPRAWALVGNRSGARVVSFTANTITINCFNDAGTANALNGTTIFVEWA